MPMQMGSPPAGEVTEDWLEWVKSPESPTGVAALAELTGVTRVAVWRWRQAGLIPAERADAARARARKPQDGS